MVFELFMRDFSIKFQEGIPQNILFSGFSMVFFHISWTIVKTFVLKGFSKENVQWILNCL